MSKNTFPRTRTSGQSVFSVLKKIFHTRDLAAESVHFFVCENILVTNHPFVKFACTTQSEQDFLKSAHTELISTRRVNLTWLAGNVLSYFGWWLAELSFRQLRRFLKCWITYRSVNSMHSSLLFLEKKFQSLDIANSRSNHRIVTTRNTKFSAISSRFNLFMFSNLCTTL